MRRYFFAARLSRSLQFAQAPHFPQSEGRPPSKAFTFDDAVFLFDFTRPARVRCSRRVI
jgi:hypothetical protein